MGTAQASPDIGPSGTDQPRIFTVGHSTRGFDEFLSMLRRHSVGRIVDVRIDPKSRRLPHFSIESLGAGLGRHGVEYFHAKELGGRRRASTHSPNSRWRTEAFRGYADYMLTPEFGAAIAGLEKLASESTTAFMCAEGLWWKCHRRLISDALEVRGWKVMHILPDGELAEHALTEFALVDGGRLLYPASQPQLDL